MTLEQGLIQWLVNQGVAVAFGIYVLVRLDTRVGELLLSVQKLTDALAKTKEYPASG